VTAAPVTAAGPAALVSRSPARAERARRLLAWTRREPVALAAVVAVAAVLRLWAFDAVGFNSDEAVYAGQAAALSGVPELSSLFPLFRAHPLLFQGTLSLLYGLGAGDVAARALVALLGLATVVVVFQLGRLLYGPRVGLVAALLLAIMPYHVGVSRQVLLDAPMTFLATAALLSFAHFVIDRSTRALVVAGVLLGLTIVTKETAVLLFGGLVLFVVLYPALRPGRVPTVAAVAAMAVPVAAYPLSLLAAARTSTGQSYLAWQLFRRPNHDYAFYLQVVPPAIGFAVLAAVLAGLWWLRREASFREGLLACWVAVPVLFFELWPTKGYQYLLVAAPVAAVLAARALVLIPVPPRLARLRGVVTAAVVVSLAVPSWTLVEPAPTMTFLAGSGGLPAGRELGRWIDTNIPLDARVMTIGPSTANIVRFYGRRPAFGLSVSPNPLSRNPSYEPIDNPDRALRQGTIQYAVWDAYTAARTPFFAAQLLRYVDKYHGVALHTETVRLRTPDGGVVDKPVMTVFEVRT
jgi:hypothetical protein